MKRYYIKTRYGATYTKNYSLTELASEAPYKIYFKRSLKTYKTIVEVYNKNRTALFTKDQRSLERFSGRVWRLYIQHAIDLMVNENAKIPITLNGSYMAIGVNKLASTRKDYLFNPKTIGRVYQPVIVCNDERIKYYYRVRFHKKMSDKYDGTLRSGKTYEVQPPDNILQRTSEYYEEKSKEVINSDNFKYVISL